MNEQIVVDCRTGKAVRVPLTPTEETDLVARRVAHKAARDARLVARAQRQADLAILAGVLGTDGAAALRRLLGGS